MRILGNLIIQLLILAALILLQIYLSKKQSKWLGLILPFICFIYSLLMVFSIAVTDSMTGWDIFIFVMSTFLLTNIPTIILVAIYIGCRKKIKQKKELDKMNIMDLE